MVVTVWILFDVSNSDYPRKNYFWHFNTREAARSHRNKQSSNPHNARLIGPYKCVEGKRGKALWAFGSTMSSFPYGHWFATRQDAEEHIQCYVRIQYRRFDHSGKVSTHYNCRFKTVRTTKGMETMSLLGGRSRGTIALFTTPTTHEVKADKTELYPTDGTPVKVIATVRGTTTEHINKIICFLYFPKVDKFGGIKVAVYTVKDWNRIKKDRIDLHFYEDNTSPLARFKPTESGIRLALNIFAPDKLNVYDEVAKDIKKVKDYLKSVGKEL